ncbi:MAG TPA: DUF2155 domain-containing protein [Nitrospirota bacterium]|nr:DUF2155 domain-containing protein [Nitrospirota bacterium]
MLKRSIAIVSVFVLVLSFGACKKKEEKPELPPGHPSVEGQMPPAGMPPTGMPQAGAPNLPKVERQVVVSNEVKAKWKAVKLAIEDKATMKTKEYTVNIGSELTIPGTNMVVKVLHFLPDFKMSDKEFTSLTDKPNMPAVQIAVMENGKEIWNNWLFSLQPTIHPFQHEKVGITLVGGVPR